jgi:hypothetical protein
MQNIGKKTRKLYRYDKDSPTWDLSFEIYYLGGKINSYIVEPQTYSPAQGRKSHSFLKATLFEGVLPGVPSTLKHVLAPCQPLVEPGFLWSRFLYVPAFFRALGYTLPIFSISNDATALRAALSWRATDDVLLGLATLKDIR